MERVPQQDEEQVTSSSLIVFVRRAIVTAGALFGFAVFALVTSGEANAAESGAPGIQRPLAQSQVLAPLDQHLSRISAAVSAPVSQVGTTSAPVTSPAVAAVTQTVEPLVGELSGVSTPVLTPIVGAVQPAIRSVTEQVVPVLAPLDPVRDAVGPLTEPLAPIPAQSGVTEPVSKPGGQLPGLQVPTVAPAASQHSEPVAASVHRPLGMPRKGPQSPPRLLADSGGGSPLPMPLGSGFAGGEGLGSSSGSQSPGMATLPSTAGFGPGGCMWRGPPKQCTAQSWSYYYGHEHPS